MRQGHNINLVCLFLCLLLVSGYIMGLPQEDTHTEEQSVVETGRVVATVNGKPIYEKQLKPGMEDNLQTFRKYGMREESPVLVKRMKKMVLDSLISEELIYQESQKRTIEDMDEKIEQRLKILESKYGTEERFKNYLKMRALTLEDLKESLRAKIYLDEYLKEQGILEPEISEELVRQKYEGNPKSYLREETIKVSHILISVDGQAGTEEKEQARQKAKQIRKEIMEGRDFAEMAMKYSDCNSASMGGSLEYIKRGYMPEEFDKIAFAIDKDVVSEVVETRFGYHIIKLFDKKPAGKIPYEEVRDFIKKFLQEQESKNKLSMHIMELKSRAEIEIFLEE